MTRAQDGRSGQARQHQPCRDEPRGNAPKTGTLGELLLAAQKRQR